MATARAIVTVPRQVAAGDIVELRLLIQHPMETGYRLGSDGQPLPRDLIRRIEARFDGDLVFGADLHAAIAANPYLAVPLRVPRSGELVIVWTGDRGFSHREALRITAL